MMKFMVKYLIGMFSSILLIFGLFAQTVRFDFLDYPQQGGIAGDSFDLRVVAINARGEIDTSYNSRALLKTSRDGVWSYIYPPVLSFRSGEVRTRAVVTLAESLALIVTDGEITNQTPSLLFSPGFPKRFLIILPGETLFPGSPLGKYPYPPSPTPQTAGIPFSVRVYLVDKNFNIVGTFDTFAIASSDSFAVHPPFSSLIFGRATFQFTPRAKGKRNIVVFSPAFSDTSSSFDVIPNLYRRLLLLLPGEDFLFGDTASMTWMSPGKRGRALSQFVNDTFRVLVYAVDSFYNPTNGVDSVYLQSDFSFACTPFPAYLEDSAIISVVFHFSGENQNIWAITKSGLATYRSQLSIVPRAESLYIIHWDTIFAGRETDINVAVFDGAGQPIPYKRVDFRVVKGSGQMLDSVILTDSLGWGKARFICHPANFSERDTIAVKSDTIERRIGIWIEAGAPEVIQGEVIAFPNPFGNLNQDYTNIIYYLPFAVDTKILIYDPFGNPVYSKRIKQGEIGAQKGVNKITWDGRDSQGKKVASGIYYIRVVAIAHTGKVIDKSYTVGVIW